MLKISVGAVGVAGAGDSVDLVSLCTCPPKGDISYPQKRDEGMFPDFPLAMLVTFLHLYIYICIAFLYAPTKLTSRCIKHVTAARLVNLMAENVVLEVVQGGSKPYCSGKDNNLGVSRNGGTPNGWFIIENPTTNG